MGRGVLADRLRAPASRDRALGLDGQRLSAPARPGPARAPAVSAAALTATRLVVGVALAALVARLAWLGPSPGVGNPHSLAGALLHWDGVWYREIARFGYAGALRRTSFFPVYPLLVGLLSTLGLPYAVAALGLSWAALFFATWSVIELTGLLFPEAYAARAGILFAWFPMSVFLLSGYAEAVYAAVAGWSFVLVARRRYAGAVGLAAVASATRPEGFLVGTVVVVALFLARRHVHAVWAGLGSLAGLLGFSVYCWIAFGTPVAYVEAQASWHRQTTWPFLDIARNLHLLLLGEAVGGTDYHTELVVQDGLLVAAAVGVVLLAGLARRHPQLRPFLPFVALTVLLAGCNARLGAYPDGSGRMMLGLAPLLALGARAGPRLWRALALLSVVLAVTLQVMFNAGHGIL